MDADQIVAILDGINSAEDEHELALLQQAVDAVAALPDSTAVIPALFRIFERFPESDGYESFWSILHTLEHLPGYEIYLMESVTRRPSQFSVLMINRIINAGIAEIGGVSLVSVLATLAGPETQPASVREDAADYLADQRAKRA